MDFLGEGEERRGQGGVYVKIILGWRFQSGGRRLVQGEVRRENEGGEGPT